MHYKHRNIVTYVLFERSLQAVWGRQFGKHFTTQIDFSVKESWVEGTVTANGLTCSTDNNEKLTLVRLVTYFPLSYGIRSSLPHSKVATTGPYTEPLESSTWTHEQFLILSGCLRIGVRSRTFRISDWNFVYNFCHARYMSSPHSSPWIFLRLQHKMAREMINNDFAMTLKVVAMT